MTMYDTFSNDYDRFVNWPGRLAGEMPFILAQLEAAGGRGSDVLDAACGTGMHAIALAQAGYQVWGADLSPGMIDRARQNAAEAGVNVDFLPTAFGQLSSAFDRKFDALLCLGNSLPHLLSLNALSAALADFAACLRPGGLLLLQNRNFDAVMAFRQRWMEPQSHIEGEEEWLFLRFYDFLPNGQIDFNIVTLKRAGTSPWTQSLSTTRLYPLLREELNTSLAAAGFGRLHEYGNLNGDPFDLEASGNLVTVAFKETP